jgi:hypothetical protein
MPDAGPGTPTPASVSSKTRLSVSLMQIRDLQAPAIAGTGNNCGRRNALYETSSTVSVMEGVCREHAHHGTRTRAAR